MPKPGPRPPERQLGAEAAGESATQGMTTSAAKRSLGFLQARSHVYKSTTGGTKVRTRRPVVDACFGFPAVPEFGARPGLAPVSSVRNASISLCCVTTEVDMSKSYPFVVRVALRLPALACCPCSRCWHRASASGAEHRHRSSRTPPISPIRRRPTPAVPAPDNGVHRIAQEEGQPEDTPPPAPAAAQVQEPRGHAQLLAAGRSARSDGRRGRAAGEDPPVRSQSQAHRTSRSTRTAWSRRSPASSAWRRPSPRCCCANSHRTS